MIGVLLVSALGAVAIGAVLVLGRRTFEAGLWTQAAGAAGVGVAGFWALASGDTLGAEFTSSFDLRVGVDGLSGLFLGTLGLIAAPALVFSYRYLEATRRGREARS